MLSFPSYVVLFMIRWGIHCGMYSWGRLGVVYSFVVRPHFFSASRYSNLVLLNISALEEFHENLALIIFVSFNQWWLI